jgi:hypothetical protein
LLYDYWKSKCGGRRMPTRGDIDVLDLRPIVGKIGLRDVERAPWRFRVRVWGTHYRTDEHRPREGREMHDVRPVAYSDLCEGHYVEVCETATPSVYDLRSSIDGFGYQYRRLLLPLAADGAHVDMLISTANNDPPQTREFWRRFQESEARPTA